MDHEYANGDSQASIVESVARRVRELASKADLSQSKLADEVGIKRGAMTQYWHGQRPYPLEFLAPLATRLSSSVNLLVTGRAFEESDDLVAVGEIDLAFGLGGAYSDSPVEVQTHQFPRAWLEKITTTPPSLLTIARGRGDSMQPTLQDGDMVIIDRSIRTVREQDALWALTVGDIAMIKRIRLRGETVTILSDNDRVPEDQAHFEEVNVVGRIVFIGRRV